MSKKDWAGLKFKLMQEMGECIDMIYIKDSISKNKEAEIFIRSHDKSDGISAFIDILKNESSIDICTLPTVKTSQKPSLFKRILLAYKHLKRQSPVEYNWKHIEKKKSGAGAGISYAFFNKDTSRLIEKFCKESGYNLNSLLLWALDFASKKKFLTDQMVNNDQNRSAKEKRVWMVPVNMRLPGVGIKGNFVTTLSVHTASNETPKTIYNQIKKMMQSGIIWGGWIVANAPKYIGERGLRLLGKNLKSPYLGLCSNLGAWPPKEICLKNTVEDQDIQWIIAAPVTSFCPISCVAVTWNERISLSCQLHPSLSSILSESEELIHDWITLLIKTCDTSKSNFSMPLIKSMPWDSVEKNAKRF